MKRASPFFLLALLAGAALVPATPAQAAFECHTTVIEGVSAPQGRRAAAEREARKAWEAAARSRFGFNHKWEIAVKTRRPSGTNRNGRWTAQADGYPCRLTAQVIPRLGTAGVFSQQTRSQVVCQNFPDLDNAKRHNCAKFYVLGRSNI